MNVIYNSDSNKEGVWYAKQKRIKDISIHVRWQHCVNSSDKDITG